MEMSTLTHVRHKSPQVIYPNLFSYNPFQTENVLHNFLL